MGQLERVVKIFDHMFPGCVADFYFDHGTSGDIAALLRSVAHDVLTTARHGQIRATDERQLLTAYQLGRILVTHNARDFVLAHHAWRLWPTSTAIGQNAGAAGHSVPES